ncbi:MAG: bifunctional riboflavin kinase/FAD synthetase [Bacteroidota bacterium]
MKIYHGVDVFKNVPNPVLTTGTFDGVHLGHRALIERINSIAIANKGESVMLTFYPHPRMVLHPDDHGLKLLNTQEEKAEQLERAGLQHLVIQPFTPEFSRRSALEYTRGLLVDGIQPHTVVVGYDHRFGRNREGDFQQLAEFGEMFDFQVEEITAQTVEEVKVSSTKIRKALSNGDVATANHYLGYNYPLNGIVIEGDGIGSKMGYPTANLQLTSSLKLLPLNGVYAIKAEVESKNYNGMLNIGVRPTVTSIGDLRVEANLFELEENLYGKSIRIELIQRIRSEQKFNSVEELKLQLAHDRELALNCLAK